MLFVLGRTSEVVRLQMHVIQDKSRPIPDAAIWHPGLFIFTMSVEFEQTGSHSIATNNRAHNDAPVCVSKTWKRAERLMIQFWRTKTDSWGDLRNWTVRLKFLRATLMREFGFAMFPGTNHKSQKFTFLNSTTQIAGVPVMQRVYTLLLLQCWLHFAKCECKKRN